MKYPGKELESAIFSLLNGNVKFDTEVRNVFLSDRENDYIYIDNPQYDDESAKDRFIYTGTIDIQVITRGEQLKSKDRLYQITNSVTGLLKPTRTFTPDLSPNFSCNLWYVENMTNISDLFNVDYSERTVITFRFFIEEL